MRRPPTPPRIPRAARAGRRPPRVADRRVHMSEAPLPHEDVDFAHNSERQFAKLLDFYGIEWEYEPRTFAIDTDAEGNTLRAFSPDFYLPAYDLYIEITTLSQKLVTKKNRKVRRLRELYPDVKIKIFYQ